MKTKANVSLTVAYLVGIHDLPELYPEQEESIERLEKNEDATLIRHLMKVMTAIVKYLAWSELPTCDPFVGEQIVTSCSSLAYLSKAGHKVIMPGRSMHQALAFVQDTIAQNIDRVRLLFPTWVNWSWIRDLFIMPGYEDDEQIDQELRRYQQNISAYPFSIWLNLPLPEENGFLLRNDLAFLITLAHQHRAKFDHAWRCVDLELPGSCMISPGAVGVVDSENVDVYAFARFLSAQMSAGKGVPAELVVITAPLINCGWYSLPTMFPMVRFSFVNTRRSRRDKSHVDHGVIHQLDRIAYKRGISDLLLFSSDDDFVEAIADLIQKDGYSVTVAVEPGKVGADTIEAYTQAGAVLVDLYKEVNWRDTRFEELVVLHQLAKLAVSQPVDVHWLAVSARIPHDLVKEILDSLKEKEEAV